MPTDIPTGRYNYIINQALFYAAHFIEGLPIEHRPSVNRAHMLRILRTNLGDSFGAEVRRYGDMLEKSTGRPFNAWD